MIRNFIVRMLASSALLSAGSALHAQSAAGDPAPETNRPAASPSDEPVQPGAPAAQTSAPGGQLQDIVVTASRTQSSAQRTPIALTVYTGADLAAAGVTNVVSLQQVDPSINVTTSTGAAYVAIRGIASTDVTETGNPSVPISRDDFFTNRSFSIATSMYDLERVEVLKGPQGTLFGRNSTGGLIRLISRKPGKVASVNGSIEVGNFDTWNEELGADLPVGDKLQFRFAGIAHYHKGYRKLDVVGGRGDDDDTFSGRATMTFQPFDGFKGYLQYQHDDINDVGDVALDTPVGTRPDGLSPHHFPNYSKTYNRLIGDRYRWEFSYDRLPGGLTFTYAGGFDKQKWRHQLDATGAGGVNPGNFIQAENPSTWNHEVRLATRQDGMFTAQGGFFHFDEKNKNLDSGLVVRSGPFADQYLVHFLYNVHTKSDGVFGQIGVRPTETIRLSAGARYTWDKLQRTGQALLRADIAGIPNFPVGPGGTPPFFYDILGTPPTIVTATPPGGEIYKNKKPTFHGGIDWTPTSRNMVYAKFDTGYKSGGFNSNGSAQPVPYGPETVKAFEIGTKNRFMDNHLQINADVFLQDYNGYQASQSNGVVSSGSGIFNVGKARIKGAEAQMIASFRAARFDVNATVLDTKFTSVKGGIRRGDNSVVLPAQIIGNRLPNAPSFALTSGLEYRLDLGSVSVTPRVDGKYSSGFYYSAFNDIDTRQRHYTLLNASLNIVPTEAPVQVLFFVRNIANKTVFANAARNYVVTPAVNTYEFQPPRTFGVRLSANIK
ncbi:MAG: TonB-dependent receptor [Sphingomicrobium sp.]